MSCFEAIVYVIPGTPRSRDTSASRRGCVSKSLLGQALPVVLHLPLLVFMALRLTSTLPMIITTTTRACCRPGSPPVLTCPSAATITTEAGLPPPLCHFSPRFWIGAFFLFEKSLLEIILVFPVSRNR